MYYEEKIIDGSLHCRTSPDGDWRPATSSYAAADALDKHRDLLREIVAYCREAGHGWLSLREAEALLGEDEALKSTVGSASADE